MNEWPTDSIIQKNIYMWKSNLTKLVEDEFGEKWNTYKESAYSYYGNPAGLKKNPLAIARALKLAWEDDLKSTSLINLVKDIIKFANKKNS